jgi:hypothetical protein
MSSPTKHSPTNSNSSSLDTPPGRAGAALRRTQTNIAPRSGSPWTDTPEHDSGSGADDYEDDELDEREWGLEKGMELFEVSAKDDMGVFSVQLNKSGCLTVSVGITQLFDALIVSIIAKKDIIEQENELKRRDSIILPSATPPMWAAQAEEEEAREKAAARSRATRGCCQT